MTKFAKKEASSRSVRSLQGKLRLMSRDNDWLYSVEIDLLDDRTTANGWRYTNLDEHREKFAAVPILIAYVGGGAKIGDGHNYRMKRTKDGREYASFTDATSERIIGTLSDNEADIRIEVRDGHKWVVGKGKLWSWYAAEAVEKIALQGRMDVSIETLVATNHMEGNEEVEDSYEILGVTILGDDVSPAVAGANIRPLSEIDTRELRVRAASYQGKSNKDEQPAKNAKGVKSCMNTAKRMRELEKLFPDERILCLSDDGLTVGLLNEKNGDVRVHQFAADEPNVVLNNRFCDANAKVCMVIGDGVEMSADASKVFGDVQNHISKLNSDLEKANSDLEVANQTIKDMQKAETERRRSEAKAAMHKALEEINRVQEAKDEEKVDEKVCEDIEKDIDEGEYDDCMNADGNWCGAEKACSAIKAKCMDVIREASAKSIQTKRGVSAWPSILGNNTSTGNPFDALQLK